LAITDNGLEQAVLSEPHPEIHIIPIQSTPAQKHSLIPGSMAKTDRENDLTDRKAEPPDERSHGSKLPSDG
jgi:hypothetical protein